MNDIRNEFLQESDELVDEVFSAIDELGDRHQDGRARRDLVGRIFRSVHTIKGTAAVADLEPTRRIAHEFETLLDTTRLGRVAVTEDLIALYSDSAAAIAESLSAASKNRSYSP